MSVWYTSLSLSCLPQPNTRFQDTTPRCTDLAEVVLTANVSASITSITGHKTLLGSSAIPSNNGSNQYGAHSQ